MRRPYGVVVCSSWGVDADRAQRIMPDLALGMARLGGVAMLFHYPGYGDSSGSGASSTIATLAADARSAAREAAARHPGMSWIMAGLFLGGSVAAVASRDTDTRHLVLLQPALEPADYVREVIRKARRRPLGIGDTDETAFGYPIPAGLLDEGAASDVAASLDEFQGRVVVIRYAEPEPADALPASFETVTVPGEWRIGRRGCPELVPPTLDWIDRVTQ